MTSPAAAHSATSIGAAQTLPQPSKKKAAPADANYGLPNQKVVQDFYQTNPVQYFFAFIILFNFLTIIIQMEIDPYQAEYQQSPVTWQVIDDICNVLFLIELMINIYGNFWRPFVRDAWSYLDTIVVIVGVLSLSRADLPGPVKQIKLLRPLRILRLFKRIESLNKILVALVRSIPGVLNAFVVMLIFMAIFAIVAVELFRDFGSDGSYTTIQRYGEADATWGQGATMEMVGDTYKYIENKTIDNDAMTLRGFHYGQEYFGTFFRSLYTLFQVLTGESWSEAVVRPLLFGEDPANALVVGLFFTFYILLTAVVLQNVVVAVLLDEFTKEDPKEEPDEEDESKEGATDRAKTSSGGSEAAIAKLQSEMATIVKEQQEVRDALKQILAALKKDDPLKA